jgi:hypothetical protein
MLRNFIAFLIYLAGVVFISWHFYHLKASLDMMSLLVVIGFYCFGVSKFASYVSAKIPLSRK